MADNKKNEKPAQPDAQPAKPLPPFLLKLKKFALIVGEFLKKIKNSKTLNSGIAFIKKLGWMGWLKISSCILFVVLAAVAYKFVPHIKNIWKFPYLSSFHDVATNVREIPQDEDVIRYANDLLAPQYMVQINKVVVNLLPSARSTKNPMMAFDLYIRADSEEATVEIKTREKQFQDHLQRFTESLTYDQIQSEEGKQTWKLKMRKELNAILNNGKVRDIYFKNLIIKP